MAGHSACSLVHFAGGLVPGELAVLGTDHHAVCFGTAAFESVRVYATSRGPRVLGLGLHLDRLRASALALGLTPPNAGAVEQALAETVLANRLEQGYVRILLLPDGDCTRLDPSGYGTRLLVQAWRGGEAFAGRAPSLSVGTRRQPPADAHLGRAKVTGSYAFAAALNAEAHRRGCDDALKLNPDGTVCETTSAHLFWVARSRLATPPIPNTIDGVTRQLVFELAAAEGIPVAVEDLPLERLLDAEEVFLSGTYCGLCPVSQVAGRRPSAAVPGPVTRSLRNRFQAMLRDPDGELGRRWLAAVDGERRGGRRGGGGAGPRVRRATPDDVEAVLGAVAALLSELRGETVSELGREARETCRRLIAGELPGTAFVAEDGRPPALVGVLTLSVQPAIHAGGRYAQIQELWVDRRRRSSGAGAALVDAAREFCRRTGLSTLEVCLPKPGFPDFFRTLQFYARCGFEGLGPRLRSVVR